MQYWFDLIWHYLDSNSRHGTHSPFVYKLADQLIYRKEGALNSNGEPMENYELLIQEIKNYLAVDMPLANSAQILDIKDMKLDLEGVIELQKTNDIVFLKHIYTNRNTKEFWEKIKANSNIIVTIDLFYFGILINRKEQPKENFKLRFPYSKY